MAFPTMAQSQVILRDGTAYTHRTAFAPSKPVDAKDILGACVSDFRLLIDGAPAIYRSLRRIRVDTAYDTDCVFVWEIFSTRYRRLLDESDSARGELLAIIRIYLALQGNTTPDDIDEMITELLGLQEQLSSRDYHLDTVCSALGDDIKTWHSKFLSSAVCEAERRNASEKFAGNGGDQAFGDHETQALPMRLRVSLLDVFAMRVYNGCRRIWTVMSRGSVAPSLTLSSSMRHAAGGANTTGHATAQNEAGSTIDSLVVESVQQLEIQAPLYGAFNELTKHLKNEVGAYLLAFQRFKAIPNHRNSKALKEMHARVACSSPRWKECIAVLNEGFACV
ncbi:hypothetical protein C8Q70DRAFT_107731 [Cubamyces menziesii]|nr:hypothetical protein C8Q70DRAFT_107731 [Cubamyces menziesii]